MRMFANLKVAWRPAMRRACSDHATADALLDSGTDSDDEDGAREPAAVHAGARVLAGEKWGANHWVRGS